MKYSVFWTSGVVMLLLLLTLSAYAATSEVGMANPAAVYCRELGYAYRTIETNSGERGVCVLPDNVSYDEWDFLEGKVGAQYSYCAKEGYDTLTVKDGKNSLSSEYAVCVTKKTWG